MIIERSIYRMVHWTLQALTAHGIHSGQGDHTHDVLLVRDANGLPALPGTSLAGVLRHAFSALYKQEATARLFGRGGEESQVSWLTVSWGLVHGGDNQPIGEGLVDWQNDDLLARLHDPKPVVRQRVRLNHRGAAQDGGKFDQTLMPAGARYSGWLGYWCDGSPDSIQDWDRLLGLLASQRLRLGHGTRSGTGQFETIRLAHAHWDLTTPEGRGGYQARPRSRGNHQGLQPLGIAPITPLSVTLHLRAESGWRVGGGERSLRQHEKEPDLLPQHEPVVVWQGEHAVLQDRWHLPGSALKGALRHRLAYHYRCLTGEFAGMAGQPEPEDCPAVRELFGFSEGDDGQAGVLAFSDLQVTDATTGVLMHNRIDRFTGGVMKGALFSEEVLWRTPLTLCIEVIDQHRHASVNTTTRQALQRTLEDLACGWLPIGAGGSRGLGVMLDESGQGPHWSDAGSWVASGAEEASE